MARIHNFLKPVSIKKGTWCVHSHAANLHVIRKQCMNTVYEYSQCILVKIMTITNARWSGARSSFVWNSSPQGQPIPSEPSWKEIEPWIK